MKSNGYKWGLTTKEAEAILAKLVPPTCEELDLLEAEMVRRQSWWYKVEKFFNL